MYYFSAKFNLFLIWLAGKICIWQMTDFWDIFAKFWRKNWWIFVQDLDCVYFTKKL